MKISRQRVIDLFFCFVLYLSSGAMEVLTIGRGGASSADTGGSPLMKVLWAIVYLVILLLMLPRRREIAHLLVENKAFVGLVLLAVLSFRWSIDPRETLSKAIPLLLSSLVGLEFARRYTTREQLSMLWKVLALIMVLGTIAELFFPNLFPKSGQEDEIALTAWHGIVTTKNTWARLIVLGGVVVLSRRRPTSKGALYTAFLMVLIFGLLAASRSTGGVVIMAIITVLSFVFGFLRWRRRKAVVLIGTLVPAVFAVVSYLVIKNLQDILTLLGKDPSMSGRTFIWSLAMRAVSARPLLGYGYSAFWGVDSRPARLIREAKHWDDLPHAHNGYIDLLLALGFIGLAFYAAAYLLGVWRAAHYVRRTPGPEPMWPLAFLAVVFIYQINETTIVAGNQLIWIVFSAVLFSLAIEDESYKTMHTDSPAAELVAVGLAGD